MASLETLQGSKPNRYQKEIGMENMFKLDVNVRYIGSILLS